MIATVRNVFNVELREDYNGRSKFTSVVSGLKQSAVSIIECLKIGSH